MIGECKDCGLQFETPTMRRKLCPECRGRRSVKGRNVRRYDGLEEVYKWRGNRLGAVLAHKAIDELLSDPSV